jgi:hypothetical protein
VCSERVPKKYGKGQKKCFGMRVRAGFRGTFGGGELKKMKRNCFGMRVLVLVSRERAQAYD